MELRTAFVIFLLSAPTSPAQSSVFEAASVKTSDPNATDDLIDFQPGGRFTANRLTLKGLIRMAYNVRGFQISGGPKWMDSDRYDVRTKAEGNPDTAEVRIMLQDLLADRFKMRLHRETHELPVYWLVIGKSGPRIRETEGDAGPFRISRNSLSANTSMAALANVFSNWLDRVVLDRTGLKGKYEVKLEWLPDENAPPTEPEVASRPGASLFPAVQEQLGLKLEPRKGPVEILVIDGAEKPREN
jgi:uncharacterized protein (TIGR03435 family)